MKKLLFASILFLMGFIGRSQKVYFIYLESENAVPFYLKMGDRIYSSSPAGYLILSNMVDSIYNFSIGFAGKRAVEPKFRVAVSGGDLGFLIKEQEQRVHLMDLQSQEVIASIAATAETSNDTYRTRDDNFTRTLSLAVNDPSLMIEVLRKEPSKAVAKNKTTPKEIDELSEVVLVKTPGMDPLRTPDSLVQQPIDSMLLANVTSDTLKDSTADMLATAIEDTTTVAMVNSGMVTTDTAIVVDTAAVNDTAGKIDVVAGNVPAQTVNSQDSLQKGIVETEEITEMAAVDSTKEGASVEGEAKTAETMYKRTTVIRHAESSTTSGFGLTYIDIQGTSADTIRILIPNPKPVFKTSAEVSSKIEAPKTIGDIEVVAQVDTITQTQDTILPDSIVQDTTNVQADTVAQRVDTVAFTKTIPGHCKTVATDLDFKDLRKEMASLYTDAGMINTAMSAFREKCFSTEQVKNLSTLFLSAQWKYLFFEAVQKYVADAENFASLESEIKDDYYLNKFKALLAK